MQDWANGYQGGKSSSPSARSKARLFWQVPRTQDAREGDRSEQSIHKRKLPSSSMLMEMTKNFAFGCKKLVRYMSEKTTVYVLECEHGKYYVGSTVNLKRRMEQHFHKKRSGSVWTKKHKPVRVHKIYRRISYRYKLGFEAQVTAEMMWDKGINNVRGAMYLFARDYTARDINSLVSFIGHYNDLSYRYVRNRLFQELPSDKPNNNSKAARARSHQQHHRKGNNKKAASSARPESSVKANSCSNINSTAKSRRRQKQRNARKEFKEQCTSAAGRDIIISPDKKEEEVEVYEVQAINNTRGGTDDGAATNAASDVALEPMRKKKQSRSSSESSKLSTSSPFAE